MDALVEDFVARRPSGLEQVYALWSRLLYSVARHALADDARAEDCVHDALLRVWRAPNRFAGDRDMLKAYLCASVRNESLGMLRSQSRRDERERKAARLSPVSSSDPPVVDPVETQRLQRALARLPAEQRTALESRTTATRRTSRSRKRRASRSVRSRAASRWRCENCTKTSHSRTRNARDGSRERRRRALRARNAGRGRRSSRGAPYRDLRRMRRPSREGTRRRRVARGSVARRRSAAGARATAPG